MSIPRAYVRVPLRSTLRTVRANAVRLVAPLLIMMLVIAALLASSVGLVACSGAQRTQMSGAFATCAEADLGAAVGSANTGTLLQEVGKLIKMNAADLESQLGALAIKVGIDGVLCAVAAVEAVLAPAPSTDTTPTVSAPPPGLVRARAWAIKQARTAS